jgi:hypothetical protein
MGDRAWHTGTMANVNRQIMFDRIKTKGDTENLNKGVGRVMGNNVPSRAWENRTDELFEPNLPRNYDKKYIDEAQPWMNKLAKDETIYAPDKFYPSRLGIDKIKEAMQEQLRSGQLAPEALGKMSVKDMIKRVYEHNQKKLGDAHMQRIKQLPEPTVHKEYPEGYKWVKLDQPGHFATESDIMGHSVRGYEPHAGHPDWHEFSEDHGNPSYGIGGYEGIKRGAAEVYSLRDPKGYSHATIEVDNSKNYDLDPAKPTPHHREAIRKYREKTENMDELNDLDLFQAFRDYPDLKPEGRSEIFQIKGKGNDTPIDKYLPYVRDFQRSTGHKIEGDFENSGFDWNDYDIFDKNEIEKLKNAGFDVPEYLTSKEKINYKTS